MYISYSGYKLYLNCQRAYWYSYIANTFPPQPDNCVNALYGSTVGAIFEAFYNDFIWKKGKGAEKALLDLVEPTLGQIIKDETTASGYRSAKIVTWKGLKGKGLDPSANYESREELVADIRDSIPRGLLSIKFYRLLGPNARSEVKLNRKVRGHTLGGRADFIINRLRPHRDLVIIDGKGSKYRDLYSDPNQLKWYAALYSLRNECLPDKLGFLYWRYGPPDSLDWIAFSEDEIRELLESVLATMEDIEFRERHAPHPSTESILAGDLPDGVKNAFPAQGSLKHDDPPCKFCNHSSICVEGTATLKALKKCKPKSQLKV